jgi:hypothetical protein
VNHFFVEQFGAGRGQNPLSTLPPSPGGGIKNLNLISFMRHFSIKLNPACAISAGDEIWSFQKT